MNKDAKGDAAANNCCDIISPGDDSINLDKVIALLEEIIYSKTPPKELPKEFYTREKLSEILLDLLVIRIFVFTIANGDLSMRLNMKGYIGGALKMLQANLKHLTWQAKMISKGDFTQRVDFMGEFSNAFNEMVVRLEETLRTLKQKEADLTSANLALTHEIEGRKAIEQSLKESEERYRNLAQTDPLTGLYNRRRFFMLAEAEVNRAFRYQHPLSVMMLDIDYFKKVNDTYGHAAGDKVLKETANIARTGLRAIDILARYGGEEFIILLPETDLEGALVVAERLREEVQNSPITIDEGHTSVGITISIGVCSDLIKSPDVGTIEEIINRADQSLYTAKREGRNRVCSIR